ncbi:MAG: hypothetical protein KGI00_04950 [Candidatus Micrarchaeota archaeon]|nr:hypothetical protein [Candidatus Micrarchaeota archaeon]
MGRQQELTKRKFKQQVMSIPDAEQRIRKVLPDLLDRMIDLALGALAVGIVIDEETGEPTPRVYRTLPDQRALSFLIEHSIGKVPQRVELTGSEGKPMEIIPWMPMAVAVSEGVVAASNDRFLLPSGEDQEQEQTSDSTDDDLDG